MLSAAKLTAADETTNTPPATAPADAAAPAQGEAPTPVPTNGIVLNFHDVPLSTVLTYLSAKAGLIVVSDVSLQGKVTVVAEQPVGTNDIVTLLDDQLGKNGDSVILQGRTLTIMEAERAKTYAQTPVNVATNGFTDIPVNDQVVTEILPLHTLDATQLLKDLDSLLPRNATVSANEAGNSIIMTGQQKDIRRIDAIVNSLDGTALSDVEVYALKYADAKAVADELKEVFQSADAEVTRASTRNNFRSRGGGGGGGGFGGFGGMFGGGAGGGGNQGSSDHNVQTHAVFVADEQLNAVVASAPPDYMKMIYQVITNLDVPSDEVTQMRVFKLKHADPGEVSDEIATLFPSATSTEQSSRSMGMRFMPPWMQQQRGGESAESPRMKRETTVTAVPDRRIQAVIVTASKDMMEQLAGVIRDLDEGDQGVQQVSVIDFGGADPATVQETLAGLFQSTSGRSSQSTTQTQTPLASRYTGNANSQTTTAQSANSGGSSGGIGSGSGLR